MPGMRKLLRMKRRILPLLLVLVLVGVTLVIVRLALFKRALPAAHAGSVAVDAINTLGIDLLRQTAPPGSNALLSPYSIQLALGMTCAGADGQTREEMIRALHYPKDEDQLKHSFAALLTNVNGIMSRESARAQQSFQSYSNSLTAMDRRIPPMAKGEMSRWLSQIQFQLTNRLLTLATVNRLYGQSGYEIRPAYLKSLEDNWQSSFESVDFVHHASGLTAQINSWVQNQTHDHIKRLIPADALDDSSRLVLVNAIYLKAPWMHSFSTMLTQPKPFLLSDGAVVQVPTMFQFHAEDSFVGYARRGGDLAFLPRGYTVVALPYYCPELQFVILMPDKCDDLPALEASLTPELLADCANLPQREADLSLPKFNLEPPTLSLVEPLRSLGMKSAFEKNANFSRTLLPTSEPGLHVSGIFQQTFLHLDEAGTEASAGTALMDAVLGVDTNIPVHVHIDRPFLFMIQHRPTGACLFLGRITDPR